MNAFDEAQAFFQFMETEDTLSNMDFIKQATYWCRKYKEYAEDSYVIAAVYDVIQRKIIYR